MSKFTFKTERSTGRYRSFYPDNHYIKLKRKMIGSIDHEPPFSIRLMVYKDNIMEDENPNCDWKWIRLKKESESLQEAKDFLNTNADRILQKFRIRQSD